jgi:hypothetical protein
LCEARLRLGRLAQFDRFASDNPHAGVELDELGADAIGRFEAADIHRLI